LVSKSGTGLEALVWLGFVTHQFFRDGIFSFRHVNVKNKSGSAFSKGANGLQRLDRGKRKIGAGWSGGFAGPAGVESGLAFQISGRGAVALCGIRQRVVGD
jgi:hypothetical protein